MRHFIKSRMFSLQGRRPKLKLFQKYLISKSFEILQSKDLRIGSFLKLGQSILEIADFYSAKAVPSLDRT